MCWVACFEHQKVNRHIRLTPSRDSGGGSTSLLPIPLRRTDIRIKSFFLQFTRPLTIEACGILCSFLAPQSLCSSMGSGRSFATQDHILGLWAILIHWRIWVAIRKWSIQKQKKNTRKTPTLEPPKNLFLTKLELFWVIFLTFPKNVETGTHQVFVVHRLGAKVFVVQGLTNRRFFFIFVFFPHPLAEAHAENKGKDQTAQNKTQTWSNKTNKIEKNIVSTSSRNMCK